MLNKILLATDFSKPADKLLKSLKELKETGVTEVLLLHVVDVRRHNLGVMKIQERSQNRLDEVKEEVEKIGLKAGKMVNIGFPSEEIVKVSREKNCDLILISSLGKSRIKNLFLGSTTHNVIRKSTLPVLIEKYEKVKEEEYKLSSKKKFRKILLPVDFSKYSYRVLELAKNISTSFQEIILVSAVETGEKEKELQKRKDETEKKLKEIKQILDEVNISNKIKVEVGEGMASSKIIEIAEEENANLIIMSTIGSGNIRDLLLGSTADRVARRSPVPVLLVPQEREE